MLSACIQGVLNGIDTALWDPAKDPLLAAPFTADQLDGKSLCKRCNFTFASFKQAHVWAPRVLLARKFPLLCCEPTAEVTALQLCNILTW